MIYFKNLCISIYSDTAFRIEYQHEKKFINKPTLVMGKELPEEIKAEIKYKNEKGIIIRTKKCEIEYEQNNEDENNFEKDKLEIRYKYENEERVWTRKTEHTCQIPNVQRCLDAWHHKVEYYPQPIIINKDGWSVIENHQTVYWDTENNWAVVFRRPIYNAFLFFYGTDIEQAFKDFIKVFGKVPLLPRYTFGAWYSRWYDYKDYELKELIKKYNDNDLPIDILVIDVDWHKSNWNGYDWRKSSFPEPEEFIKYIKSKGIKIALNDHPGYGMYDPLPDDDSALKKIKEELKEPSYKGMWSCDWSRKSVVKLWARETIQKILKQGIDIWWIDGWGDWPFCDTDGQLWLNWQYYELTQEIYPEQRVMILSRWGGLGSHRYPVQFSGDTYSNFETLKHQIYFTAYSGGLGAYYWSHDIGGFHNQEIDEEVYIRWVQFGCFSPVFRTHSNHGIREPYNFSERALRIYKNYMKLRYRLVPYFEQLHFKNVLSGFPLFFPMNFIYLNNENAEKYKEQYFFGEDIIVAPICEAIKENKDAVEKEIWLPEGKWLDILSGEWKEGEKIIKKEVRIDETPIFVKKGGIIISKDYEYPIKTSSYKKIEINIYEIENKEKIFYFDDGITKHNFDKEKVSKLELRINRYNNNAYIELNKDESYTSEYLPEEIKFNLLVNDEINIFYQGNKIKAEIENENLFSEISSAKFKVLSWC